MQCHWLLWIHKLPAVEELILHLILPHICEGEVRGSPWNVIPQLLLAVGGRGGRGKKRKKGRRGGGRRERGGEERKGGKGGRS